MRKLLAGWVLVGSGLGVAQAIEPPPPPDLRHAEPLQRVSPTPPAASAPSPAASEPRRVRAQGAERIRVADDAYNRTEEHLDARGHVVRVVVFPKNGAPPYELRPTKATDEQPVVGPRRWKLMDF